MNPFTYLYRAENLMQFIGNFFGGNSVPTASFMGEEDLKNDFSVHIWKFIQFLVQIVFWKLTPTQTHAHRSEGWQTWLFFAYLDIL